MTDEEGVPREYTKDEVLAAFLDMVRGYVDYWACVPREGGADIHGRLSGLAFSILVMLDGDSALPGFIVAPNSHAADKQDAIDNGENWYPTQKDVEGNVYAYDIAGSLHDDFYTGDSR